VFQPSVLVVDDEVDIRESLREVLEEEGYEVTVACDGQEGLAGLRRRKPCAVILDIIMPVMSGTEMYAAMQEDPALASIPVIVSTSDPSRAPSGVLIMKKPVDLSRLLAAVAGICRKASIPLQ
jgi:two-component system, sensor histidine kinase and response regulator